MTQISYYAACQAGVDVLDTAISPLSGGTSQPPTESMVAALQGTPYDTELDLKSLTAIKKYFDQIKEKYLALIDPIAESIDTDVLMYQIPGGMLSNLISQLKEQNALDRYNDVLDEMPRVRKDMGYPPLVTPTSQIVGIQAVMNVLGGERYKTVSNEVKEYMKGDAFEQYRIPRSFRAAGVSEPLRHGFERREERFAHRFQKTNNTLQIVFKQGLRCRFYKSKINISLIMVNCTTSRKPTSQTNALLYPVILIHLGTNRLILAHGRAS